MLGINFFLVYYVLAFQVIVSEPWRILLSSINTAFIGFCVFSRAGEVSDGAVYHAILLQLKAQFFERCLNNILSFRVWSKAGGKGNILPI